jgi:hypothetical protein
MTRDLHGRSKTTIDFPERVKEVKEEKAQYMYYV